MQENHRIQGHLFGAFSVLVWGTTFVSTKVLLRAFTPLEIMVARFTLGFLALLIVGKGLMRPQKRWHEGLFALAGLSGVTLYFLMENIALTYISASLVGVIVAAAPAVYRADRSGRAARKTQQMVLFRLCLCDGGCRARVARGSQ